MKLIGGRAQQPVSARHAGPLPPLPAAFFRNSSTSASLDRPPLSLSLFHSTCGASLTASERAEEPSSPPDFLAAADGCSGRGLRAGRPPLEEEDDEDEEAAAEEVASSAFGMSVAPEKNKNSTDEQDEKCKKYKEDCDCMWIIGGDTKVKFFEHGPHQRRRWQLHQRPHATRSGR